MGDPLADLNPAQREAVRHGDGPLMVLAGAGSGKTRVITRRIAWLLDQGVSPDSILALTFTNKAAGEMAQRVQALGGHRVRVATFHSACARFLRVDGHLLGYPRAFSIYDTYDRDVCIKQLLVEHGVTQGGGVTPSKVGSRISRLKNLGVGPADFISGLGEVDAAVRRVYAPYLDRMRDLGAMDFDDLLLRMCDLLAEHPAAAEVYQERFRYLLVDEFQDTNVVQYRLVRLLTGKHQNVCVVGDPDQSIYRFRGAELRNILDFENDYPAAALIRLETNYRSTGCILAAAQGLIENNRDRLPKTLRTDAEFGAPIKVVRTGSDREEADEVAGAIAELLRHGVGPEQVAVFYRTHFLSRAVEQAFRQRGIGYDVVGGLTFFERREIKDLLAFLRVLVNPLDDVSMLRIVNVPPRGVGKTSLQKLVDAAADGELSLLEAVCQPEVRGSFTGKARTGLQQLAALLESIDTTAPPDEVLREVLAGTGYMDYAAGLGDVLDQSREENIQELLTDAAEYAAEHADGLAGYLQHVSLLTSQDEQDVEQATVTLMTVHSAKGLEFDHVFVLGLEEGTFPHARSLEEPVELEEERRLMYVAITRARQALMLSYAAFRMVGGVTQRQAPSRFLAELPSECTVRASAGWTDDSFGFADADSLGYPAGTDSDFGVDHLAEGPGDDEFDEDAIQPGTRVLHRRYGRGAVVRMTGEGIRMRVVVAFDDGRERTLIPEYGQLQILRSGGAW